MFLTISAAICAVLLICLVSYLNVPIAPNTGNPHKYRILATVLQIFDDLAKLRAWWTGRDYAEFMNGYLSMMVVRVSEKNPDIKVTEDTFDGVQVFIYQTHGARRNRPGLTFYHGGGFMFGHPFMCETLIVEFVKKFDIVVVAPRYTLSAVSKAPAQHEDCKTATNYFFQNAEKFGVNPKIIGSSGDSAGGNLAAAMCIIMKDQKKHQFAFQVLIYPWMQVLDNNSPSRQQNYPTAYRIMTRDNAPLCLSYLFGVDRESTADIRDNKHVDEATWNKYKAYMNIDDIPPSGIPHNYKNVRPTDSEINRELAEKIKTNMTNPHVFPLCADDLSGLPPAFVLVVENDPIRDDGIWYAKRLERSGVKVTTYLTNGFHGMMNLTGPPMAIDAAVKALDEMFGFMAPFCDT